MVTVSGPDPLGKKAQQLAFHQVLINPNNSSAYARSQRARMRTLIVLKHTHPPTQHHSSATPTPDPHGHTLLLGFDTRARLQSKDGVCTTSVSATRLPDSGCIIFPASAIAAFLQPACRATLASRAPYAHGTDHAHGVHQTPARAQTMDQALHFLPGVRLQLAASDPLSEVGSAVRLDPGKLALVRVPGLAATVQSVQC